MKNTQKYIKTRGQLNASQQNKLPKLTPLSLANHHKKSTSSSGKDQNHDKDIPKTKIKQPSKTKKITKKNHISKSNNKSKQPKIIVKGLSEMKKIIPPKISVVKLENNSTQKKVKIQPNQSKSKQPPVKKQEKSSNRKNTKQNSNQLALNHQKKTPKSQNNLNLINGIQKNIKSKKKQQQGKSTTKIEVQEDNNQTIKPKIQHQVIPKPITKSKKIKTQSKLIRDIQPPISNIPINIIPQPATQSKKKGRPKKVTKQFIYEQRSPDELIKLEEFIENTIKLRKLKCEKQLFQSFSRITQYAQESWEYGDLGRDLKYAPQRQEILKIGIPIVRGIRKHIQQQQLLNLLI